MAYLRMTLPFRTQGLSVLAMALALVCLMAQPRAEAMSTIDFLTSLSENEMASFQVWKTARQNFEDQLDAYWDAVERKRAVRRQKRAKGVPFSASDYVMSFPPKYKGPFLSGELAAKYDRFLTAQRDANPSPPKELATLPDYLAAAKRVYNFVPERVSEKEFKLRYAAEAAALGLSKEQVVRVYALETGGVGTYDTQAGIHPIKKTGRAISSALGYGQLLDANSVNELARSGATFIRLLTQKYQDPRNPPARKALLKHKLAVLKKMYANVKHQPFEWDVQQAYAKTPPGMGIHALNIDGDLGPMLQAMKLRTLQDLAAKAGRTSLSGAELELMNLAGPMTGLEMMAGPGSDAPTPNFFARRAYYVNKMVIGLTGTQLQAELDRRMAQAITNPGSQEFADAFDSVSGFRRVDR
ncbi:MAG: hypothetical protein QM780_01230 [Hyphomicrobium sp.]|uniref:hypothetical protein n=1 Tax=Hyphomicrobium sp. TaxID=82 RepID=UPI0039E2CB5A